MGDDYEGVDTINQVAMPLGLTLLLLIIVSLSHRREMMRLKANGQKTVS